MARKIDDLEREEAEADELHKKLYDTSEEETEEQEQEAEEESEEEEAEEEETSEETWEQRYKTLKGKYDAEVPRLSAEIAQWGEYANSLKARIEALEKGAEKKAPDEKEETEDEDVEALAEDYPDFARVLRNVNKRHSEELAALKKQVESNSASVNAEIGTSRQSRFEADMARLGFPNWRQIDKDPKFLEWLQAPIPYTDMTRLDAVKKAASEFNAERIVQFFTDFQKSTGSATEEEEEAEAGTHMEKFIAPPKSEGPSAPKRKAAGAGLTRADYERFMNPRYRYNPADWGGKSEREVEAIFDKLILERKLR